MGFPETRMWAPETPPSIVVGGLASLLVRSGPPGTHVNQTSWPPPDSGGGEQPRMKMTEARLRTFRDRLELPIRDAQLAEELPPYAHPGVDLTEYE
jgi:hypothetical protein